MGTSSVAESKAHVPPADRGWREGQGGHSQSKEARAPPGRPGQGEQQQSRGWASRAPSGETGRAAPEAGSAAREDPRTPWDLPLLAQGSFEKLF